MQWSYGYAFGIAVLVVAPTACNKAAAKHDGPPVEVKLETPAAALGSLSRLYASSDADQRARAGEVVDPALVRERAREAACEKETSLAMWCEQKMMESLSRRFGGANDEYAQKCTPLPMVKDCACGAKGTKAAANPTPFAGSDVDRGLAPLFHLLAQCAVTDSTDQTGKDFDKINPFIYKQMCADVSETDKLAFVSVKCPENTDVRVVFRGSGGNWKLLGFDAATDGVARQRGAGRPGSDE